MGIQGLLPFLKPLIRDEHVRVFAGQVVGIDASSWLHKAAYGCAWELCQGIPTDKYVGYCLRNVEMLRHFGVEPLLVFDGRPLPMKGDVNADRKKNRETNKASGIALMQAGDSRGALECFQKAVEVSSEMVGNTIEALRQNNVRFVVAPFEADAQLAYLSRNAHIFGAITEDSDLLAFGCQRVFFKMDKNGSGTYVDMSIMQTLPELALFDHEMFLQMCIMAGCDYLSSARSMGIKTAHKYIKKCKVYTRAIQLARMENVRFSPTYVEDFKRALLCFKHQNVYDPVSRTIVNLTPPPPPNTAGTTNNSSDSQGSEEIDIPGGLLSVVGEPLSPTTAQQVCEGHLSSHTLQPFVLRPRTQTQTQIAPATPTSTASTATAVSAKQSPAFTTFKPRPMPAKPKSDSTNKLLRYFNVDTPQKNSLTPQLTTPPKQSQQAQLSQAMGMYRTPTQTPVAAYSNTSVQTTPAPHNKRQLSTPTQPLVKRHCASNLRMPPIPAGTLLSKSPFFNSPSPDSTDPPANPFFGGFEENDSMAAEDDLDLQFPPDEIAPFSAGNSRDWSSPVSPFEPAPSKPATNLASRAPPTTPITPAPTFTTAKPIQRQAAPSLARFAMTDGRKQISALGGSPLPLCPPPPPTATVVASSAAQSDNNSRNNSQSSPGGLQSVLVKPGRLSLGRKVATASNPATNGSLQNFVFAAHAGPDTPTRALRRAPSMTTTPLP